jgi:hypothetical protein
MIPPFGLNIVNLPFIHVLLEFTHLFQNIVNHFKVVSDLTAFFYSIFPVKSSLSAVYSFIHKDGCRKQFFFFISDYFPQRLDQFVYAV